MGKIAGSKLALGRKCEDRPVGNGDKPPRSCHSPRLLAARKRKELKSAPQGPVSREHLPLSELGVPPCGSSLQPPASRAQTPGPRARAPGTVCGKYHPGQTDKQEPAITRRPTDQRGQVFSGGGNGPKSKEAEAEAFPCHDRRGSPISLIAKRLNELGVGNLQAAGTHSISPAGRPWPRAGCKCFLVGRLAGWQAGRHADTTT